VGYVWIVAGSNSVPSLAWIGGHESTAVARQQAVRVVVEVQALAQSVSQLLAQTDSARRLPDPLHRREEQADQNGDYPQNDQ